MPDYSKHPLASATKTVIADALDRFDVVPTDTELDTLYDTYLAVLASLAGLEHDGTDIVALALLARCGMLAVERGEDGVMSFTIP